MIADYTNTTIIPVMATPEQMRESVGSLVNGSWTGYLEQIWDGNVDTVTSYYQFTEQRSTNFAYSYPVYSLRTIYVAKQLSRQLSDYIWHTFDPYSTCLWIMLLVFFILQSCYGTFVQYFEKKTELTTHFSPLGKFWQYCRMHILQGDDKIPFISDAGHLAFITYALFQVTFFTNLYQPLLLSALFKDGTQGPFTSVDQVNHLVKTGEYTVVTFKRQYETFWFYNSLKVSSDSYYVNLRDALRHNPLVIKDTLDEVLGLVKQGRYIYITQEDASGLFEIKQICGLSIFSEGLPCQSGYYLFLHNNSMIKTWNHAIIMNDAFIRRTYYKYFEANFALVPPPICPADDKYQSEVERPLGKERMVITTN
ncbi:hypothetical protein FO519_009513 [Halicephalobus sp. NKZ332]|nr:hypothetical protein FO519_009513 [Halicephalobus sp. NKZ332]